MKKKFRLFLVLGFLLAVPGLFTFGQMSITTDKTPADPSAMLDVKSTTKGMLIPRMTAAQRNAISSPTGGLLVYQTDQPSGFYYYLGAPLYLNYWTNLGMTNGFSGSVIDMDGNVYPTVRIGAQEWMVRNLKVTHYLNGDPIPNVPNTGDWIGLLTGAYCFYGNSDTASTVPFYGLLYNWYAVNDSRSICPSGWHVPTYQDWTSLTSYFGGTSMAGSAMKTASQWIAPNIGNRNTSGFSAYPAGYRSDYGAFLTLGSLGSWWSGTAYLSDYAYSCYLYNTTAEMNYIYESKNVGNSVRCIKN